MCIGEKRTLTIGPSYGYGDRSVGPIPAGSTLGMLPSSATNRSGALLVLDPSLADRISVLTVFETEMVGIEGVPKPESIVTKSAAKTEEAAETGNKVAEKVASVVSEAAEAAKTFVADSDDGERDEL